MFICAEHEQETFCSRLFAAWEGKNDHHIILLDASGFADGMEAPSIHDTMGANAD